MKENRLLIVLWLIQYNKQILNKAIKTTVKQAIYNL